MQGEAFFPAPVAGTSDKKKFVPTCRKEKTPMCDTVLDPLFPVNATSPWAATTPGDATMRALPTALGRVALADAGGVEASQGVHGARARRQSAALGVLAAAISRLAHVARVCVSRHLRTLRGLRGRRRVASRRPRPPRRPRVSRAADRHSRRPRPRGRQRRLRVRAPSPSRARSTCGSSTSPRCGPTSPARAAARARRGLAPRRPAAQDHSRTDPRAT